VLNKTDLVGALPSWTEEICTRYPWEKVFHLSAKDGQVEELAQWLSALAPKPEDVLVTSARQARLLEEAASAVSDALASARLGLTADAFLMDAERDAMFYLILVGVPALVAALICSVFYGEMKTANESHEASAYEGPAGLALSTRSDRYVTTRVSRTRIERNEPRGGGGHGGMKSMGGGHGGMKSMGGG
jgi:uncharacterized membrane protein YgcG